MIRDRFPQLNVKHYDEAQEICPKCGATGDDIDGVLFTGYMGEICDGMHCWCYCCTYSWHEQNGEPAFIDGKWVFSKTERSVA